MYDENSALIDATDGVLRILHSKQPNLDTYRSAVTNYISVLMRVPGDKSSGLGSVLHWDHEISEKMRFESGIHGPLPDIDEWVKKMESELKNAYIAEKPDADKKALEIFNKYRLIMH